MTQSSKAWENFFLLIGILAILSGIFFILEQKYFEGIAGASVGALVVMQNLQNRKKDSNI